MTISVRYSEYVNLFAEAFPDDLLRVKKTLSGAGAHEIYARVVDYSGKNSTSVSDSIIVDTNTVVPNQTHTEELTFYNCKMIAKIEELTF